MSTLTTAALGVAGLATAALVGWGAPALADHGSDDPSTPDARHHRGDDDGHHHRGRHGHHAEPGDDHGGHGDDD